MGFNGGVFRHGSISEQVVLETTWAPRYTQPRIIPANYSGVECGIRTLANPANFDRLKPIVIHLRE
jgi:hypothetical protein